MKSLLLTIVLLVVACSCAHLTQAEPQQCATARVRRSWTALSAADRQLYKDAIATAMDSGAYNKFLEIHTDMMSEREAHHQCMFFYWHRKFIVGFENMLRGQHARFACVTIPYWDWITDYSKFAAGMCTNMLDCSPALSFLGGRRPVASDKRAVTINGRVVHGFCANDQEPMNHFCQDSQTKGTDCIQCVPRGNWTATTLPASASYMAVRAQVFGSANIAQLSSAIERGAHAKIHNQLGGVMPTMVSPSDPLFWSHHATVDVLYTIFHECKVGEKPRTLAQKIASADWASCKRRNTTTTFQPTDHVTMRTGFLGRNATDATQDPIVGAFMAAVPQHFAGLMDTRDMGASSYTYALDGLLGELSAECSASELASPRPVQAAEQVQPAQQNASAVSLNVSAITQQEAPLPPTLASSIDAMVASASQRLGARNRRDSASAPAGGRA